jgi:D-3-phosphoglycerate dehydrogenase
MSESELIKVIGQYDGMVIRSATKVTPDIIQAASKMRIIGRAGVGVDNINIPEATKAGIVVMNTPDGNTVSTAQLAMSLLCTMARKVPSANMSVKDGKWDRKSFSGVELHGKTLGVVGCGRIGQVVASCARGLGMEIIGYDPIMTKETMASHGINFATLDDIWAQSDFITVHTPLTDSTRNLINDETINACKDGVYFVNCARGGIIDESVLLKHLQSGKIAGAALDVYQKEPPPESLRELLAHPNLVCTPHLGASTEEAQVNVASDIARQMCDVYDQKDYVGVVNASYLAAAALPQAKPFMELAEVLGLTQGQLSESKVTKVEIRTWGGRDINIEDKKMRELIKAKVLQGMVRFQVPGMIPDLISSPTMAEQAGIDCIVSDEAPESMGNNVYQNLISVHVVCEDGTSSKVSGAVFGSTPHIVHIDECQSLFAFKPEGNFLLSFRNQDRPGSVSEVLKILHHNNVNVGNLNVARLPDTSDSMAICFMALDSDIPTNAMNQLKNLSNVSGVAKIQLK